LLDGGNEKITVGWTAAETDRSSTKRRGVSK
jgi:hypothetical protein